MAIRLRVQHVLRDSGKLTHIGGLNGDAKETTWQVSVESAIAYIRNGILEFYVSNGQSETTVIVATNQGKEYLRTEADDTEGNNLSSLPEYSDTLSQA